MESLIGVLPLLLLVLVCPLAMFFVMRMNMGGGVSGRQPPTDGGSPPAINERQRLALLQLRQEELDRQIAAARRDVEQETTSKSN